jgi:hypothetical protein
MLGDRIEHTTVPAEPALVGQRTRDVASVELRAIWVERVHPASGNSLQVGTRRGRRVI